MSYNAIAKNAAAIVSAGGAVMAFEAAGGTALIIAPAAATGALALGAAAAVAVIGVGAFYGLSYVYEQFKGTGTTDTALPPSNEGDATPPV